MAAHVQRLALGARGVAAERLLAALVAGLPADLVVYAVAAGVVAVHEQRPARARKCRVEPDSGGNAL